MIDQNQQQSEINNISVFDVLLFIAKYRRLLVLTPIFSGTIFLFISFTLPNVYRSNTKLLPPQQNQSAASAMLSQLGGLAGGASSALGIKNPNDLYVAILKSRTVSDKLIQRFNLKERYNQKYLENTRKKLDQQTSIISGKDNIISIDVEDEDPKIAAEIANAYVEELSLLTSKFALTEASQRRVFYEKQLDLSKERMIAAENILSSNIPNSGLISVDTQSKAILETTAKLRASISAKEIQIKSIQTFHTPNSPQYKSAYQELNSMKNELEKLESGSNKASAEQLENQNFANGKKNVQSGTSNFQLLRDVKYNQMLYELIAKQYELAKIDEAKDMPSIQVLDRAIEPEYKFKPRRGLMTIAGFFLGLIFASILALSKEKILRSNTEENSEKLKKIKENLKKF